MTQPPPIYDLVLLLDPQLEEPARAKIVADARAAIEAQGELLRHDPWGERPLAYPIARKASAEYHLLQFHATTPALLDSLEHSLRIIDGLINGLGWLTVRLSDGGGIFDRGIIDGLVNLVGGVFYGAGARLRRVQTGYLRSYVLFLVLAAVGIFVVLSYFVALAKAG